jgi:fermentation-respiration switch protein FrsA (DUF1100 family)
MRILPLSFSLITIFSLSACVHVNVEENQMIRPDRLTNYKRTQVFTTATLNQLLPKASLKEEFIEITPELKLAGLSMVQADAKVTVLYFGGNLSHVDDSAKFLSRTVGSCPLNFSSFDYRGYGRTAGEPSVDTLKDDALRIYDYVRAQNKGPLVVHGHSLGSFMAGYIAQNRQIDALILETTATTVNAMIQAKTPWYAAPFIKVDVAAGLQAVDNARAISQFRGKSLVISAEKDTQTPHELGRQVFDAIPSADKRYFLVPDAGHSGLLARENVKNIYCDFIKTAAN